MLKLWNSSITSLGDNVIREYSTMLPEATGVCVLRSINGEYTLSFNIVKNTGAGIEVRRSVEYDGQLFRIKRISEADGMLSVECEHIFLHDAKNFMLESVAKGDCIGEDAYTVIEECIRVRNSGVTFSSLAGFYALTEEECAELGMKRIKVNIDFEAVDKITFYEVIMQVIECAGIGELYVDNNKFAIVESIGCDTETIISTATNMSQCTVETDTAQMITRLYPYGKDNLEITNAAANENRTAYIDSENIHKYGAILGYIDYGDCTDPDRLLERAAWSFDADNPDRIDVPGISISGLVMGCDAEVGDKVRVVYDGEIITARLISLTRYPYDDMPDTVTLGRQKKDMYYYLNQVGALTRKYAGVSVNNGKIRGSSISGVLKSSGLEMMSAVVSADAEGNMYINGKKILVEEE